MNQPLRNFCAVLAVFSLVSPLFAQQAVKLRSSQSKPKTASPQKKVVSGRSAPEPTPQPDQVGEKQRFEAALAAVSAAEKAELLVKFIADFPKSELKLRAEESLAGARAVMADERLTSGDLPGAVKLFRLVIETAPMPYSDRLFTGIIATIPANLYWRGHKSEGVELARLIESNIAGDARHLLLLSTFYLGTENGMDAKRLAEAAVALDEKNAAAHQAVAQAHRLNFDLESAETSFAKAVELDPASTVSKRSLAEMKRALGKAEEAEAIYREILAVNEKDNQARTGLTLALFDQGKRIDAEAEMEKTLAEVPGNVVLLASAAYWYAANKVGEKAVEHARRAIALEPRYIWSHIALGRGLMIQGKPVDAEQALVSARKYGNFPTLQYEIASARFAAGFFREAVEEIRNSFAVTDGKVRTKLGGRIDSSADSFAGAIAMERRASIFAPKAADSPDESSRLMALVELSGSLAAETKDEAVVVDATDRFSSGTDNMAIHRKLYAANLLLQNSVATEKAMELAGEAVVGLDRSLDVANPGAAVMANELYEARNVSFARNDFLLIPEVPRQTLIALMRGKVEDTTGLALLQQGKAAEATIRFKRALTVLPKDSAWWRAATWNLGTSLAAEGKDKEALETMISSYSIDKPSISKYLTIEALWVKVNGSREGLEEKIGPNPLPNVSVTATAEASPSPNTEMQVSDGRSSSPETTLRSSEPKSEPTPLPEAETKTEKTESSPSPKPVEAEVKANPSLESAAVEPAPANSPKPEAPVVEASPSPSPEASPEATPAVQASPEPSLQKTEVPAVTQPGLSKASETTVARDSQISDVPKERKPSNSLFDPIVISIPNSRRETKPKPQSVAEVEKALTPIQAEQSTNSGVEARPRIVEGKAIVGELMPCQITVSQESVSLINSGGSMALIVSIEEGEDIRLLTARSNSPRDVEVRLEPALVEIPGRSMFVVKSVSDRTGLYQVVFTAPCGRKELMIRVR